MKKAFKKSLISTICMLVVGIVSLTGVTYAWFTSGTTSTVTGMDVTAISTSGGIMVADTINGNYVSTLTLTASKTNAEPVSTVGGKAAAWSFFKAKVNSSTKITASAAEEKDYVKHELFLKNEGNEITVTLAGSTIEAQNGAHLASRLGIRYVETYTTNTGNAVNTAKGSVNGDTGFAIYEPNATTHTDTSISGKQEYKGVNDAGEIELANSNKLAVVTTYANAQEIEIKIPAQSIVKIEVYVWLEGQDVECTNIISGTSFTTMLKFELKA